MIQIFDNSVKLIIFRGPFNKIMSIPITPKYSIKQTNENINLQSCIKYKHIDSMPSMKNQLGKLNQIY